MVAATWGANNGITASISDSQGNLYATAVGPTVLQPGVNYSKGQIFYAANSKGGANTVTITLTNQPGAYLDFYLHEYGGIAASSPLDQVASATGNGVTVNSGSVTTQSNELLFGFGVAPSISSAGNGFTLRQAADGNATADRNVNTGGTYNATFTSSGGNWIGQLATFKAAPLATYAIMASSTPAIAIGRVKYRLSASQSQPAGTYTTLITYTILGTF